MAEPKKKSSKTRTGWRRSQFKKKTASLIVCSKCKQRILPHRACPFCGTYKGKQILKLEVSRRP